MKKITFLVAALCATTMAFAETITIDESNVTWGTSYANCPSEFTVSGQTFDVVNLVKGKLKAETDSCLQFSKLDTVKSRAAGYIANKTELDLVSIVLTKYGDYQNLTIYAGATAADLAKVNLAESGSTYTATMPDGAKFFKIINESSYAAYCASIVINVDGGTAIRNIEVLNDVYAHEGHIYAEEGAQIYTVMGLNVTEQNKKSTLGEGIYIVKAGNKLAKIVVK